MTNPSTGFVAPTPVSALDVAAKLQEMSPNVWPDPVHLHKLLYFCQGHNLAHFGQPLFTEAILAGGAGPVVDAAWIDEDPGRKPTTPAEMTNGQLCTLGSVISRYGNLTPTDLTRLSSNEPPYLTALAADRAGTPVEIRNEWMRDYFRGDGAIPMDGIDPAALSAFLAGAAERARTAGPGKPDDLNALRARADALRTELAAT